MTSMLFSKINIYVMWDGISVLLTPKDKALCWVIPALIKTATGIAHTPQNHILTKHTLKQCTKKMFKSFEPWETHSSVPPHASLFHCSGRFRAHVTRYIFSQGRANLSFHRLPNLKKWFFYSPLLLVCMVPRMPFPKKSLYLNFKNL